MQIYTLITDNYLNIPAVTKVYNFKTEADAKDFRTKLINKLKQEILKHEDKEPEEVRRRTRNGQTVFFNAYNPAVQYARIVILPTELQ